MPRGGYRPGAGRPRGEQEIKKTTPLPPMPPRALNKELNKHKLTPLAYMLQVINDDRADEALRLRAAACAAPYVHARKQETGVGKKERDQETAKEAAVGKYLPPEAPGVYSPLN